MLKHPNHKARRILQAGEGWGPRLKYGLLVFSVLAVMVAVFVWAHLRV